LLKIHQKFFFKERAKEKLDPLKSGRIVAASCIACDGHQSYKEESSVHKAREVRGLLMVDRYQWLSIRHTAPASSLRETIYGRSSPATI